MGALREIKPKPVPEVVALLRDLLKRAQAGEITGIAIGAAMQGRESASAFHIGEANIADLYLSIERCKIRLLAFGADDRDDAGAVD